MSNSRNSAINELFHLILGNGKSVQTDIIVQLKQKAIGLCVKPCPFHKKRIDIDFCAWSCYLAFGMSVE